MLFVYWECEKNSRQAARAYVERYPSIYLLLINTFNDLFVLLGKITKQFFVFLNSDRQRHIVIFIS